MRHADFQNELLCSLGIVCEVDCIKSIREDSAHLYKALAFRIASNTFLKRL